MRNYKNSKYRNNNVFTVTDTDTDTDTITFV